MIKVLFVYGYGGSPESTFYKLIKEALPSWKYNVVCPEYPQDDIFESRRMLGEFIQRENIDLIVGTSLGAFISLSLKTSIPCVAINPCMVPSVELPLLKKRPGHPEDKEASKEMLEACKMLEQGVNEGMFNVSQRVIGLFAKDDELLGTKYKKGFKDYYDNVREIPGGHHGNTEAIPYICQAIEDVMKPILYIDMDNVLADFKGFVDNTLPDEVKQGNENIDEIPGIFAMFPVYEGAKRALETLKEKYDLYVLSTSPWNNPTALQDKHNWLKENFGNLFHKHVIFTHQKNLCVRPDAWLVDDRPNHGAHLFGRHWLSFGPNGKYKNWDEVVDFLMNRQVDDNDMESFCEYRGFTFHTHGHGKWGAYPFYTFGNVHCDLEYTPFNNEVKINSSIGSFKGNVKNVEELLRILDAMRIDVMTIENIEESRKNSDGKKQRKLNIANRIATQIQIKYNFDNEKCFSLATQGDWWQTTNHLSQLSNRVVERFTEQVFNDIESGNIK